MAQFEAPVERNLNVGRRLLAVAAAIVAAVAIWWPISIPLQGFMPSPADFARAFADAITGGELYVHMAATMRRVLIGWAVSVVLGTALGVVMGRSHAFDSLALPWVMVGLATPAPVIIIFCILILGIEETSTLIALVIAVTPFVINIVYQGVRSTDPGLINMANVYRVPRRTRLREIILPQIAPSLMAGTRFGFAMSWKIVVIIEAMSSSTGIGAQIELFFRLLQPASVLAWVFCFTIVMVVAELLVFRPVETRLFRWRRAAEV